MLSRFIAKPSHRRFLTLLTSQSQSHISNHKHYSPLPLLPPIPNPNFFNSFPTTIPRHFSSNNNNNNDDNNSRNQSGFWNISSENDQNIESVFGEDSGSLEGTVPDFPSRQVEDPWVIESKGKEGGKGDEDIDDIFKGIEDRKATGMNSGGMDEWRTAEGYKDWNFVVEEGKEEEVFDIGKGLQLQESEGLDGHVIPGSQKSEEDKRLEIEEEEIRAVIKGPNRAFGDLITASGITEAMLDSLILLKDLEGIEGLPPLRELEELRYENNTRKSSRAEIERLKQEEVAKARVRQVDSQGRAYGTGKRKCSIARVWIQPGEGKFLVNDKQFDVYFPMLDHRAALLRPFTETKTLGLMDVSCTVKGGGVSGQVGAIRLGISRALQNWAPDSLRPPLKAAGFLTRDSRVVERKKPGKAKARKSYQWVKR